VTTLTTIASPCGEYSKQSFAQWSLSRQIASTPASKVVRAPRPGREMSCDSHDVARAAPAVSSLRRRGPCRPSCPSEGKVRTLSFWDFLVWLFWVYVLIACVWIFISIVVDLFRDHSLGGWGKALWVIFLIFLPFLAAIIYLIARGRGMAERSVAQTRAAQAADAAYIRDVAGAASPTAEIEKAQQLLAAGTISQAEFDALKAKAIAA
jgi:hypothetical protein